ncbi:glutamate receptor 2.8-like [Mercurialis annua]|uniref:glutamate receptor 2.8-like n=1 Tax=Mercurialis annua TaxID=3986 RepID=UPI0024AE0ABB|nr:glutamate receptor 2.8-like [Mercurialis annua]
MARKISASYCFILCLIIVSLTTDSLNDSSDKQFKKRNLGVIVDSTSREGKEEIVAMRMAIEDFYANCSHRPTLQVKNSHGDSIKAVSSAKTLIKKHHVLAILGMGTWQEVALVAELGDKSNVPVLSLANVMPQWSYQRWHFLINSARSQFAEMKAVAAVIQSWQWRKVNVLYEDIPSTVSGIFPYLISALQDAGSEINDLLPLSPLPVPLLSESLKRLKNGQCRVFIVHTSAKLANIIFTEAKKLGMMENEFVWITTVGITNLIDTFNSSVISSMQGVVGVKSYYPQSSKRFKNFYYRFRKKFHLLYKHDPFPDPGINALQAYDAMRAVALAMEGFPFRKVLQNSNNSFPMVRGHKLLSRIKENNFEGLTGAFILRKGMLASANTFRIVNVVGKSYREVGYWTENFGFSETIDIGEKYSKSMQILGHIFWPGNPWLVPRGWAAPTNDKLLKIGVPMTNTHKEFIDVKHVLHKGNLTVSGFSVDVFKSTLESLPYALPYIFVPFNGTYDSLVEHIKLQSFDAVVADTAIVAHRCKYAEFSQPYADPGLQIRHYNRQLVQGPIWEQIGRMLSTSFITLFSLKGDKLHSNLSRMAMAAWLFVALVITQSFTANLTTLLTVKRLDPILVTVETLKESRAKVGCDGSSFVVKYLEQALGFDPENIVRMYSGDHYAEALSTGEIAAAFLEVPYVKVFLAKNCKGFSTSGPTFRVGGFGFVFPRNSPYLPDISEAILRVAESGRLKDLESSMTSNYKCAASKSDNHDSLGLSSYWGIFAITGGTSTFAVLLFAIGRICERWHQQVDGQQQHPQQYDPMADEQQQQPQQREQQQHDPAADEQQPPQQHDPTADEHHLPDQLEQHQDHAVDEHFMPSR